MKGDIHFIGVLGSGMYPLASLLLDRGYGVTGYDRRVKEHDPGARKAGYPQSDDTAHELRLFGDVRTDWQDVSLAVYSLAMDGSDPEIISARESGVPMISRAQLLGWLMSGYGTRISVSGSHGKSTVTAIIDCILSKAGSDPTVVSGATLSSGRSYRDGRGEIFLAEACEYKDSFLRLCPTHQVITSVELDHTDYFPTIRDIRASFFRAAEHSEVLIVNADDPICEGIADELSKRAEHPRIITYGKRADADYKLVRIAQDGDLTGFSLEAYGHVFDLETRLIGEYNLYNITAAVALAKELGVADDDIQRAVRGFSSIERRMTKIAEGEGVAIYYDYAHHPTELRGVIEALKARCGSLTVIFRPHTYSRTKSLWNEFIVELCKADLAIILDIYPAREKPIKGITSENLAKYIPGAIYSSASSAACIALSSHTGAIALLGAGDVEDVKADLIKMCK